MQLIITASKDCYITDKIIDNKYRSKNSNSGHAATLDLFKLFEESGVIESGNFITSDVTERSALLINFDYSKIGNLTSSLLNIKSPNFKAYLELQDLSSGLQKPFNFSALCSPLVRDFEEGFGIDVNTFNDLASANYLTSSFTGASPVIWKSEGASAAGGNDSVYASGSITVAGAGGWDNTVGFTLNDGSNSVSFLANTASPDPARTDSTNYTFGIQGATTVAQLADKVYAGITLSKTQGDLKITATDPGSGSKIPLRQDAYGLTGNTDITLANAGGRLTISKFASGHNTDHIDIITSASYGTTIVDLGASSYLSKPSQDLIFDVTNAVSSSLKGLIPDHGFRIGFSGSYDTDNKTRFVKRFASRHIKNKLLTPKLRIIFDDEISDDSNRLYINNSSTVTLKNKSAFQGANLRDNSNNQLTGANCGILEIASGSFTTSVNFSQVDKSSNGTHLKGVYQASFTLASNNAYIKKALTASPDGFDVDLKWKTSDSAITFLTKKARVHNSSFSTFDVTGVSIAFKNRKPKYSENEDVNIECAATLSGKSYSANKTRKDPDSFPGEMYYRISELVTGKQIIPLNVDTQDVSVKMSFYNNAYSALIKRGTLPPGYSYKLELYTKLDGNTTIFNSSFVFKVV